MRLNCGLVDLFHLFDAFLSFLKYTQVFQIVSDPDRADLLLLKERIKALFNA